MNVTIDNRKYTDGSLRFYTKGHYSNLIHLPYRGSTALKTTKKSLFSQFTANRNQKNRSHLLDTFTKHVHQAKTTLPNSITLQSQTKQESEIPAPHNVINHKASLFTYSICCFFEPLECCLVVLFDGSTPLRIHL